MIDYLNTRILGAIVDPNQCVECRGRRDGVQVYSCVRLRDQVRIGWDIELALQICAQGHQPEIVPPEQIAGMLRVNAIEAMHVGHVDPDMPGIACVLDRTEAGEPIILLIDGSHRAARCLIENRPFYMYVLTGDESRRCQDTELVRMWLAVHEHQKRSSTTPKEDQFDPACSECRDKRTLPRVFTFERVDRQVFSWAIDLAIQICSDGRTPLPVPTHDLDAILGVNDVDGKHLDHVDPDIPGIGCACGAIGGQPLLVLIDGSHRAARCRRDGRPFLVYLLSAEESQRCQEHVPVLLAEFARVGVPSFS